jgi:hypothetical protein
MLLRDGCRTTANRKSTFAANVAKLAELLTQAGHFL